MVAPSSSVIATAPCASHLHGRPLEPHVDTAVAECLEHLLACERLLSLDQALATVDERHRRPEPRPGLRHLDPDHATAEDGEPRRHLAGRGRLDIRPRARVVEPVDIGDQRGRAGGDHDRRACEQELVVDEHPSLSVQAAAAAYDRDAALLEPRQLTGVVQMVDHLVPPPQDRVHVQRPDRETRNPFRPRVASSTGRSSAFEGMQA